ncbi:HTH-type transcriptional regulator ZntR [Vibrio stylophorae]|uniref:HTH-type transcriptional regulator ZntR n=1 Tax=Vibrio stylophorae TaxID=659351 RepID=A0ABM8ZQ03_9VIBR|nr:Zn(2+)-responsive transcriptional regulator [Vibrio stylophorae]CAH0532379.1 HTH-type transcriptional regulator ZntR [Vibrio stylophorae]
MAVYLIGQLAKKAKVSTDTLRFYEKNGLISPSGRSESGYRVYNEADLARVAFIVRSKAVGLSLEEIGELLTIRLEATQHSCSEVKAITQAKLDLLDQKIAELQHIRKGLKKLNDACCGTDHDASHCSILEALADEPCHICNRHLDKQSKCCE